MATRFLYSGTPIRKSCRSMSWGRVFRGSRWVKNLLFLIYNKVFCLTKLPQSSLPDFRFNGRIWYTKEQSYLRIRTAKWMANLQINRAHRRVEQRRLEFHSAHTKGQWLQISCDFFHYLTWHSSNCGIVNSNMTNQYEVDQFLTIIDIWIVAFNRLWL